MKKILFSLILSFVLSGLYAQSIAIQILPEYQTITSGQNADYSISVNESGGFDQQVFFEVVTHNFNNSDVSFTFSPNLLNPPYTEEVTLTVSTNGGIDHGEYMMIIEAGNGPVLGYDTCYLNVDPDSCLWFEHENIGQAIRGLSIDENNNVWVSDMEQGLKMYDGSSWTTFVLSDANAKGSVAFDSQNNKWIPTDNGLVKFDGENWTFFNTSSSQIPTNSLNSVAVDADDVIWIGTNDAGIVKYDGVFWTVFNSSNSNLLNNEITNIRINSLGIPWFRAKDSSYNTGIGKLEENVITLFTQDNTCLFEDNFIISISIGNDDEIWISSLIGVIKFNEVQWEQWLIQSEDNNHTIRDLDCNIISQDNQSGLTYHASGLVFVDDENNIWISSIDDEPEPNGELIRFDGTNWDVFNRDNSTIPDDNTHLMAQNNNNDLWFVTLQNSLCCDYSVSVYTCDSLVTSLNDYPITSKKFNLYPNPTNDKVYIDFGDLSETAYLVEILNINGGVVFKKLIKTIQNNNVEEINISQIPDGIYFIRISNGAYSQVKKLVIY